MNLGNMTFDNGILHLANWMGNVIMPTIAAAFIVIAILAIFQGAGVLAQHVWGIGLSVGFRIDDERLRRSLRKRLGTIPICTGFRSGP